MLSSALLLLFCSCIFLATRSQAVVHRISAQLQPIPAQLAETRSNARKMDQQWGLKKPNIVDMPLDVKSWRPVGNISLGTPAQQLTASIDVFAFGFLGVLDSRANLSSVNLTRHTFNSSASTSYVSCHEETTCTVKEFLGTGDMGKDVLNIGGVSQAVKFARNDNLSQYYWQYNVDAFLGLAPEIFENKCNQTSILDQLAPTLNEPVMSLFTNLSLYMNGSIHATLGALDTDHCQSNWVYASQVKAYAPYSVNLTSAEATINGTSQSVGLNRTLLINPYENNKAPMSMKDMFMSATNAVYNYSISQYIVDCDLSKIPDITLNIGGSTGDGITQPLVLKAADYIFYWKQWDVCCLNYTFSRYHKELTLGREFLNNHCMAFNMEDRTVGFADIK